MNMQHEYSDNMVTPWGGMKEMKTLIDKTGISKKLLELGLPQGKSNNRIDLISIIESFWVSIWIGCFRFKDLQISFGHLISHITMANISYFMPYLPSVKILFVLG
ncbi:MAG TPA: hypothetical protein VIJ75_01210 [Hanamia sp.]